MKAIPRTSEPVAAARPGPLRALGWGHRGFQADRRASRLWLLALLALPMAWELSRAARCGPGDGYVDYNIFHRAAVAYLQDPQGPIYETHPSYLYPPFFLTVFGLLAHLPFTAGLLTFQLLKWAALYGCVRLAWRLGAPAGEDVPPIVALAVLACSARFLWNEMLNGNINIFILAAVLLAGWLFLRERPVAAGFVATAAACVKVTPALLIVYFLYKRRWGVLPGVALGLSACLLAWPAAFVGWEANLRLLAEWYEHMIAGFIARGDVWSTGTNESLTGVLNRLFGDALGMLPDVYITIYRLPPPVLSAVRAGLMLGVLAALAWACRGRDRHKPWALAGACELALIQIAMLILSGYTWKAHFVAMLLPFTVLLAYLADARYPAAGRRWAGRLLVAALVLFALSGDIVTPAGADLLLAYGVVLYGAVAAGAGLMVVRAALRLVMNP